MIIAPTLHCSQTRATEHTIVGERDMGDARFDYVGLVQDWFDHFVKGVDNEVAEAAARARVHDGGEPVAHLRQLAAQGSPRR